MAGPVGVTARQEPKIRINGRIVPCQRSVSTGQQRGDVTVRDAVRMVLGGPSG